MFRAYLKEQHLLKMCEYYATKDFRSANAPFGNAFATIPKLV